MTVNRTEKAQPTTPNAARGKAETPREPQAAKTAVAGDGAKTSAAAATIAQARAQVTTAIKAAIGANGAGLDFEGMEWQPGARFAVVPDKDGTPHTFMVRQTGDGYRVARASASAPAAAAAATGLSLERQAMLEAAKARLAAKTQAVEQTATRLTDGNVVAKAVGSFLNVFNKNQDEMREARDHAVKLFKSELPGAFTRYESMLAEAGSDPAKIARAQEFLDGSLAKADLAAKAFDKRAAELTQTNKFWSGTFADVAAGLATLGGVALCMTTFGLPIGAGLIAGAVAAGGATTVAAHALFDNQYDLEREGLANFLVGGIGAAATTFTAGLGGGALQFGRALIVREGVVGGTVGLTGAMASEGSNGWQAGWQGRVARGTLLGAGLGAVTGGVAAKVAGPAITNVTSAAAQRALQTGVSAGVGGVGAGTAAVANEALDGFQEGWQDRVVMQTAGGAFAGAAYSVAPNLNARHQMIRGAKIAKAGQLPESVHKVLTDKLQEMGLAPKGRGDADNVLTRMLEDDAVGALMRQTLNDERYGSQVRDALEAYGTDALNSDMTSPEGRAARLQLLTMSLQPETRRILVDLVHKQLGAETAALKAHYKANPADALYDVVVLGGGPNGVTLANVANEMGTHSVLLTGDFTHFQREGAAFYTNSLNGTHKGNRRAVAGENNNPVYGAAVQTADFAGTAYNQAGQAGDAAALGLAHAASGKATDVMIDTYAVATRPVRDAQGQRLYYEVQMSDGTLVRAKTVVGAGGLGKRPNYPANPVTRKVEPETQRLIDAEFAKTQAALAANDPAALAKAEILTTEQFLTAGNRLNEPGALFRDQEVIVLGAGDGGITPAELMLGLAPDEVYGITNAQMGAAKQVTMVGKPDLWHRYARLERMTANGKLAVIDGTYCGGIRRNPESGKVEVWLQPMKVVETQEQGRVVTRKVPDGEGYWRGADKVVLATGTQGDLGNVFGAATADGKPINFRDGRAGQFEPIDGQNPSGDDGTLHVASKVKGEDLYAIGVAAALDQRKGYSWLQDHGARTDVFARQIFGKPAEVGLKAPVAVPQAPKQEIAGGLLKRALGGPSEAPIARDEAYRPAAKRGDTSFRLKVALDQLLTQGFRMPDLSKLRVTVSQKAGKLVLRSPDLDPVSARKLAAAIATDKDFAAHLHDYTRIKPADFAVEVAPDGHIVSRTLTLAD